MSEAVFLTRMLSARETGHQITVFGDAGTTVQHMDEIPIGRLPS